MGHECCSYIAFLSVVPLRAPPGLGGTAGGEMSLRDPSNKDEKDNRNRRIQENPGPGLEQCYPRRSGQNLFSEPLHLFWGPQCPVLTFTLPSSTHPDLIPRMTSPSNPFLSLIFSHLNSNLPLLYPRAIMSYRRPGKPAF